MHDYVSGMENGMKTDISIAVNRSLDNNYRGNMYLGFAAFLCGVFSILMFMGGLNAIGYSADVVYVLAFFLSLVVCYSYYKKPRMLILVWLIVFAAMIVILITETNDLQAQVISVFTAFSEGKAAVRNVTMLMCVFTMLLVGLFYLVEFVFKAHFILSFITFAIMILSPFLKISISGFNIFMVVVYQIMFYLINNMQITKKKRYFLTGSVNSRRSVIEKSAVMCFVLVLSAFVVSNVIMKAASEPVYNSVSGLEEIVYKVSSMANNKAADINMDGSISTGNNYQTGAKQIALTLKRKPEEDLYLTGYRGGEYTGNNWKKADDTQICNELDKLKGGNTYNKYTTIINTAEAFNTLYYSCNYLMKNNGMTISKEKDKRLQLDIEYKGNRHNVRLEPYYSNLYSTQQFADDNKYSVMYYEQKDMASDWNNAVITEYTQKSRLDDYIYVQSNYKKAMKPYYTQYSEDITPRLASYVKDNPLTTLDEKTTFILYTLMSNTSYTRSPGIMVGNTDIADKFLFESKKGYCVHYATAAALMYRMYGIPARYVTGFKVLADSFKENEQHEWCADVTDARQHAWVEIFIDNYGWVPVDVTPSQDGTMNVSYPGYTMDTFKTIMEQNNWVAGLPSIKNTTVEKTEYVNTWQGAVKAALKRFFRTALRILKILIVVIVMAGVAGSPIWLRIRRSLVLKRRNTKKCAVIYSRMMKMLHKSGYAEGYDGTEEDFADELIRELSENIKVEISEEVKVDIRHAVMYSVESEFSSHRVDDLAAQCVNDVYNKISDAIYNRLCWWEKIIFKYIYCF